jgi:8-hydroxy-5-deazaflavin:NADPH oxidoreductase
MGRSRTTHVGRALTEKQDRFVRLIAQGVNFSVAEHLQEALPQAKIVKTMNTAAMTVMVNPASIKGSSVFVSGDDAAAKSQTRALLGDLGWSPDAIIDLGGIESARGPEHYFLLFAQLAATLKTGAFNIHVVT